MRITKVPHGGDIEALRGEEMIHSEEVVLVVCMDDDIITGEGDQIVIGTPGSFVTKEGNSEGFPDSARRLVEKYREVIFTSLQQLFPKRKIFLVTSHLGCGALALQGVTGVAASIQATRECSSDFGDFQYAGHIDDNSSALHAGETTIEGVSINRPESDHAHHARRIVFTIGGGITGSEIERIKTESLEGAVVIRNMDETIKNDPELTNSFIVSADWAADAIKMEGGSAEEVAAILKFITDVAHSIMQKTMAHKLEHKGGHDVSSVKVPELELVIFDGGRLEDEDKVEMNRTILNQALSDYVQF